MLKRIKNTDHYLLAGLIIVGLLIFISLFGSLVAPYDISEQAETIKLNPETGEHERAPFAPSIFHWMGTDELGTDMLSKLMYGTKYTLIVVFTISLSRMLLGVPLGLIAGWWPRHLKGPVSYLSRAWSSMPLFLFVYMILAPIVTFGMGGIWQQISIIWLVLTLAGLPPIVETVRGHVETVKNYEFMDGVKVLGASPIYSLRKHILPHIKPYLAIILSMEMAQILWLLGQLGIFHIFVGGTIEVYDDMLGVTHYYSETNEWAGLLGYGRRYYRVAPWIVLAPATAFTMGILGFQFLAEGLRRKMNKNVIRYDL